MDLRSDDAWGDAAEDPVGDMHASSMSIKGFPNSKTAGSISHQSNMWGQKPRRIQIVTRHHRPMADGHDSCPRMPNHPESDKTATFVCANCHGAIQFKPLDA